MPKNQEIRIPAPKLNFQFEKPTERPKRKKQMEKVYFPDDDEEDHDDDQDDPESEYHGSSDENEKVRNPKKCKV